MAFSLLLGLDTRAYAYPMFPEFDEDIDPQEILLMAGASLLVVVGVFVVAPLVVAVQLERRSIKAWQAQKANEAMQQLLAAGSVSS